MRTLSNTRPDLVSIEKRWDGKLVARFAENITEQEETDERGNTVVYYAYDEYAYITDWSETERRKIERCPEYYINQLRGVESD